MDNAVEINRLKHMLVMVSLFLMQIDHMRI